MRGAKILSPREWEALKVLLVHAEDFGGVAEAAACIRARVERDLHRQGLKRLGVTP